MYRVINGKRYNTETAEKVAEDSYGARGDFSHWTETLYQKSTGEFFLYGEGGPMSKYSEYVEPNARGGGEKIIPLSLNEAQAWVEKHTDGNTYDEIFGTDGETGDKVSVTIRLTESAAKKIKLRAASEGKSISSTLEDLINAAK